MAGVTDVHMAERAHQTYITTAIVQIPGQIFNGGQPKIFGIFSYLQVAVTSAIGPTWRMQIFRDLQCGLT